MYSFNSAFIYYLALYWQQHLMVFHSTCCLSWVTLAHVRLNNGFQSVTDRTSKNSGSLYLPTLWANRLRNTSVFVHFSVICESDRRCTCMRLSSDTVLSCSSAFTSRIAASFWSLAVSSKKEQERERESSDLQMPQSNLLRTKD